MKLLIYLWKAILAPFAKDDEAMYLISVNFHRKVLGKSRL